MSSNKTPNPRSKKRFKLLLRLRKKLLKLLRSRRRPKMKLNKTGAGAIGSDAAVATTKATVTSETITKSPWKMRMDSLLKASRSNSDVIIAKIGEAVAVVNEEVIVVIGDHAEIAESVVSAVSVAIIEEIVKTLEVANALKMRTQPSPFSK